MGQHWTEKRGMDGPLLGPPCDLIMPDTEKIDFRQLAEDVWHGGHNVVVVEDAIFNFADTFTDFGVTPDEVGNASMLDAGQSSVCAVKKISTELKMCLWARRLDMLTDSTPRTTKCSPP